MNLKYYVYIIDTDKYAGNFERQLTAWCTGIVGDCKVGEPEKYAYLRKHPPSLFENYVVQLPDEHGWLRPTTIYPTPGWSNDGNGHCVHDTSQPYPAYQSVGIFLDSIPPKDLLEILKQRALSYKPLTNFDTSFTILGFRLLAHYEEDVEIILP